MSAPIFLINGPPAAGKSSLARELMGRFERGFHIPVDDLREWVVSGISHPIGWTDETTRQFRLAEEGAARLGTLYASAGFAVALDHCASLDRFDEMARSYLADHFLTRVLLLPPLDVNLRRNALRLNKDFDPGVLESTIAGMYTEFGAASLAAAEWLVLDSGSMSVAELADLVMEANR